MSVLINFKICDNSKDCNGIKVCPAGAFYWQDVNKSIAVDNEKCISCGNCEKSCQVGAIRVTRSKNEWERIKKEIEEDPRTVADLFVDRYGADSIDPAFAATEEKFQIQILEATKVAVVELYNAESIRCLLKSIPLGDLFKDWNILYRKIKINTSALTDRYGVNILPSLLFFKDTILIGKIEGYFSQEDRETLQKKIDNILS